MAEELKDFLITLGEDPAILEEFKQDPRAVMSTFKLSDEEQSLVLEGNKAKLHQTAGLDEEIVGKLIL